LKNEYSKHPLYHTWKNMISRCTKPHSPAYARYGGRGISVCQRWTDSFPDFVQDMGEKPSSRHSLDRVDSKGNYCPENCRWATRSIQSVNAYRPVGETGFRGVRRQKKRFIATLMVADNSFYLGCFATAEEAYDAYLKNFFEWYGFLPTPASLQPPTMGTSRRRKTS
jgi:hypothetical protein